MIETILHFELTTQRPVVLCCAGNCSILSDDMVIANNAQKMVLL